MKKKILFAAMAVTLNAGVIFAQTGNTMVGGESMYPAKNIIENAVNSKDHTTLVAAVKAAGLVETLQGKGPFTVLAPVSMKTVAGGSLTFMMNGSHNISVKDENGGVANISTYDVYQSNGVIHVLDKVLLPKM